MSFENAIEITNLSKAYQIYAQPHDRLKQFILPRLRRFSRAKQKDFFNNFWALHNVSFKIPKGTTMGIIGRNGSGKSTLLQLICGTLNPSSGNVTVNGRVAALLELGSGFNPDFTGRQNVYMNAAVLGLSNKQIDEKFDSIAAFADIGEFIEQPIKTYSSGMMVRLAFAVIAHVDADILIIDEALAVGDAVFTQKCMRWLRNFQKNGTVLFVSHDTSSVLSLCDQAMWLHEGHCKQIGDAKSVAEAYLQFTQEIISTENLHFETFGYENQANQHFSIDYSSKVSATDNLTNARGWKTGRAEITKIEIVDSNLTQKNVFEGGEQVCIRVVAKANEDIDKPILGFLFRDRLGQDLFGENTLPVTDLKPTPLKAGESVCAEFHFTMPMLPNGDYELMTSIAEGTLTDHTQHHWLHNALLVKVSSSKIRWGLVGISFNNVTMERIDG